MLTLFGHSPDRYLKAHSHHRVPKKKIRMNTLVNGVVTITDSSSVYYEL